MAQIKRIRAVPELPGKKKRVAAYARVSMESDNLLRSLSNQVSSYSELIRSRPDWEYAGVYSDSGISGTSTEHRDNFRRLMEDCEAGKIDLVLTKSISRFARNTVDLLAAVRHLKEIGVEVYFEEQQLSSMAGDSEPLLTLLAAVAQEEAEAIRANVLWGIRKRFEQGIPNGHKRFLGYGWDGEQYVIIPEEADTVRRIFEMYLGGMTSVQIAKALNGASNISGGPISDYNVRFILDNENYTGNLLLQKRYSPQIGKRSINHGEMPMYRVEEDHEPVIDAETFARAQDLRKQRRASLPEGKSTCFSGLLKCGYCGHAVCRRNAAKSPVWVCNAVDKKGKASCSCGRRLPEAELKKAAAEVLGEDYERDLKGITVFDDRLVFREASGKDRIWKRHFGSGPHERGCFSGKVFCGSCGGRLVRESRKGYAAWICRCGVRPLSESELRLAAADATGQDDDMGFYVSTDRVLVFKDRMEFYMKSGEVVVWQRK